MSPNPPLILASASPRRRELLGMLGVEFQVVPSTVDEAAMIPMLEPMSPSDFVQILALAKAEEVWNRVASDTVVIGADTVVVIDNQILGKPKDAEDAVAMLHRLSGRTHQVYTGVVIVTASASHRPEIVSQALATDVTFQVLSDDTIIDYVATGEPMDKAGAYGIQDIGKKLIKAVEGDYFNVVGLPLELLRSLLLPYFPDIAPTPPRPIVPYP